MKYVVTGRVHPERADVFFLPVVLHPDGGGSVALSCDASQLTVVLDAVPKVDGYVAALLGAHHFAQTMVAALGFSLGTGYTVEMIRA